jgi:beta-lactamase class D
MIGDLYIQSVIDQVPAGMPLRDHIALELRSHIAERMSEGRALEDVVRQLGDPLKLAESYLAAVPMASAPVVPRLGAKLIDIGAVAAVVGTVTGAVLYATWPDTVFFVPVAGVLAFAFGFPLYSVLSEYAYGQTLGKRLMGMRVVRESGARVSLGQAVVRQLPFFAQFFWVDALFALFTERKQRAFELLTKTRVVAVLFCLWLMAPIAGAAQTTVTVHRCVVIYDEQRGELWRSNLAECSTRLSPASTFKIPHALVALEAAVVTPTSVEKWDGTPYPQQPLWNRDHTVLSAMKPSVLWLFQRIAPRVGAARMHEWLERLGYGNADTSGDVTQYWVNGTLRVSPDEQVAFLRAFFREALPVRAEYQRAVHGALQQTPGTQENARGVHKLPGPWHGGAVLHSKTGATTTSRESVSWLVGALTVGGKRYVFASAAWSDRGVDQLAATHHAMATFRQRRILPVSGQ